MVFDNLGGDFMKVVGAFVFDSFVSVGNFDALLLIVLRFG
ncbi:hypothetical protein IRB23M11_23980 [Alkalibacterium sp. m-11]